MIELVKKMALLMLFIFASTASSAVLKMDGNIAKGGLCVGMDCSNGESFGQDTLRLKENNLRIAFDDSSGLDKSEYNGVGQRWLMSFNSTNNGGRSFFSLSALNTEKNTLKISDGASRKPSCDGQWNKDHGYLLDTFIPAGEPVKIAEVVENKFGYLIKCQETGALSDGSAPKAVCDVVQGAASLEYDGVIPAGEPVISLLSATHGIWGKYKCVDEKDFIREHLFTMYPSAEGSIHVGKGAGTQEKNVVALGGSDISYQLKNIAIALKDTDLVTMADFSWFLAETNKTLDNIERIVTAVEKFRAYTKDNSSPVPHYSDYEAIGVVNFDNSVVDAVAKLNSFVANMPATIKWTEIRKQVQVELDTNLKKPITAKPFPSSEIKPSIEKETTSKDRDTSLGSLSFSFLFLVMTLLIFSTRRKRL